MRRPLRIFALLPLLAASAARAQYDDAIIVSRALIDVRVTDSVGNPIEGLTPADFIVEVDGKAADVESVEWIDENEPRVLADESTNEEAGEIDAPFVLPPKGRLMVLFIQTDFARERVRLQGQMNFRHYAEDFIETLRPHDRVAVFSFDSHLKFRSDFTSDQETIRQAVRDSLRIDFPEPPPAAPSPSLSSRLDRKAMRRVSNSEGALLLLANALRGIDGPKSLLLMGWGLGERQGKVVTMRRGWGAVRQALDAARVTIFAIDTTYASSHDLALGLQVAAKDTGGFYMSAYEFARGAVLRLERTLAGHYEVEVRPSEPLKPGSRELTVRVNRRGAVVLAPSSIIVEN